MNCLVIGYGSIGKKHAEILKGLGHNVAVLTKYPDNQPYFFLNSVEDIPEKFDPDYVVIANKTSEHSKLLHSILTICSPNKILIEKPLSLKSKDWNEFHRRQNNIFIGYNLRFHPVVKKLKKFLEGETILSSNLYVGQYLPDWRPKSDYRISYSAKKEEGGGVIHDLSHELDLMNYFFGSCQSFSGRLDKISDLEINCEDHFMGNFVYEKGSLISLNMNLIDRKLRREIIIHTKNYSTKADLVEGTLDINDQKEKLYIEKDISYKEMHLSVLENCQSDCCSFEEGLKILRLIEKIERSSQLKKWIANDE